MNEEPGKARALQHCNRFQHLIVNELIFGFRSLKTENVGLVGKAASKIG